jgi:hypothetical protein
METVNKEPRMVVERRRSITPLIFNNPCTCTMLHLSPSTAG